MNISKNSLVSKMIKKTFWWLGEEGKITLPKTSCGYFFGGICSGLLHILVLLCVITFFIGFVDGVSIYMLKPEGLPYYPVNVNHLSNNIDFTPVTTIPFVFLFLGFTMGVFLPYLLPVFVLWFLWKKGILNKGMEFVFTKVLKAIIWVGIKSKVYVLLVRMFSGINLLMNKLKYLCKDIDYKD